MANWNGYRASRAAGGGALNGYYAPKRTQVWGIGMRVNVGFLKNLLITSHEPRSNIYSLVNEATGARYQFEPHLGLSRV